MNLISAVDISGFLNGNIFGYLLHSFEIILAEGLFGLYLKRRKNFAFRAVSAVIIVLAVSLGLGVLFELTFVYFRYLISFVISLAVFPLCYDTDIWDELFCCIAGIASQNMAYSVSGMAVGLLGWNPVEVHPLFTCIQSVIYCGAQVLCFLICARKLKAMDGGFGKERLPMVIFSLILVIIVYVVQHDRQSLGATEFLLWRFMFIVYDISLLFMLFGMSDRSKLRRENAVLDSLRASEERRYEFDKQAIEQINIKCHDLKHRIIALGEMTGDERADALKDVEDAVMIYDSVAKTGCKPLDTILSNKYLVCEQNGIRFTYMIDGEKLLFMSAVDIYSLFGNALDNAIRAVKDVRPEERRIINMSVVARGSLLTIHVENYIENVPVIKDGILVTTKDDKDNHGFGMLSMRRIVESYGGVMSVECINKMFNLDMTIPIKDTTE